MMRIAWAELRRATVTRPQGLNVFRKEISLMLAILATSGGVFIASAGV